MKRLKKPISALLALVMMVGILCVAPFNVFAATNCYVSSAEEFISACDTADANGGEYNIYITKDFTVTGGVSFANPNVNVTFYGEGHTISFTGHYQGIQVWNGAVMNFGSANYSKTLTLKGDDSIQDNDNPGLLYITNLIPKNPGDESPDAFNTTKNSVCNMYDGVTVKDHKGNNYYGGGVTIQGGIFHMYGGTIDNCGIEGGSVCYGGGVGVTFGGQFIMDDGIIKNCHVASKLDKYVDGEPITGLNPDVTYIAGGGVFVYQNSSFVMNGGSIEGCTATNESGDGGFPSVGGGVAAITSFESVQQHSNNSGYFDACFNMSAGTIKDCEADYGGAVGAGLRKGQLQAIATQNPDAASNPNTMEVNISGGTLSDNTASILGGGMYLNFIRQATNVSNLTLTGNKANEGGAVCINGAYTNATFDTCTIKNNKALSGKGGAIYINNNNDTGNLGKTAIKDCEIKENTATDKGGGVYYSKDSTLYISGQNTIQDNTVGENKNNLYFQGKDYPVYVSGSLSGSQIGITDAKLWEDGKDDTAEDAESSERLTDGFKAKNASLIPADAFTSDHDSWVVDYGEKITEDIETIVSCTYTGDYYKNDRNAETGYPGYSNKYIKYNSPNFSTGTLTNATDIYYELVDHYTRVYGEPDDEGYFYDTKSHYYIYVALSGTFVYVFVAPVPYYGNYDYLLCAGKSHQDAYALDGEVALQVRVAGDEFGYDQTIPTYESVSSATKDITFKNPLSFSGDTVEIQERNDLGIVTGKYIINKSSEQINKITTPSVISDYTSEVRLVRATYTLHYNDGSTADYTQSYNINNPTSFTVPTYEGHTFLGWYDNAEFSGEPVSNTPLSYQGNVDYYAKWTEKKEYDVNYHINNEDMDSSIYADDIFTPFITNHEVKDREVIQEFHNIPKLKDPDGYVFKGWYYDQDNNDDRNPIVFGQRYDSEDIHKGYHKNIDIYAHWEKVDKIEQEDDNKLLPDDMQEGGKYYYDSFGLFGVQLRPDNWIDENTTVRENGGLRFATSIGEQLLKDIDKLSEKKVESEQKIPGSEEHYMHDVEYGFVTASKDTTDAVVNDSRFNINKATYKLQYKGADVNGVDTLLENATYEQRQTPNNFRYVTNVDCTSQKGGYGGNDAIKIDHRDCNEYRIATFVVTYQDKAEDMAKNVVARAYMRYYDANGLLRTFYNDYGGTTVYGGCCTSYNAASKLLPTEPIDYNNQITN